MPLIFTSFCQHKFDIRKIFKLEKYAAKNEFGSGFNNFLKKKKILKIIKKPRQNGKTNCSKFCKSINSRK